MDFTSENRAPDGINEVIYHEDVYGDERHVAMMSVEVAVRATGGNNKKL